MPQTKIVFFDIDGTLIDMQAKKITPKMLETLHRLQNRGIKICIATGRSPMVLPKIDGVAFDAYLTDVSPEFEEEEHRDNIKHCRNDKRPFNIAAKAEYAKPEEEEHRQPGHRPRHDPGNVL